MLVDFGDTRVLCTASVEERVPGHPERQRQRLGHRRVRHAAALHAHAQRPRGGQRQAGRTNAGDPAADRPQPARGRRPRRPRRAHPAPRLRRPAGRWRHAHRSDHRRLGALRTRDGRWLRRRARMSAACATPWRPSRSGLSRDRQVLDLDYGEDSRCDTDMNVVMTGAGKFVEVQGTAEGAPFSRAARRDARPGGPRHRVSCGAAQQAALGVARRVVAVGDAAAGARNRTTPASCASSRRLLAPLSASTVVAQSELGIALPTSPMRPSSRMRWPRRAMPRPLAGLPALADDSGLCVPALGGRPACARRASRRLTPRDDERNNRKLMRTTATRSGRRAHYYCMLVLCALRRRSAAAHRRRSLARRLGRRRAAAAASATTLISTPRRAV